jgi:hypothetical protein
LAAQKSPWGSSRRGAQMLLHLQPNSPNARNPERKRSVELIRCARNVVFLRRAIVPGIGRFWSVQQHAPPSRHPTPSFRIP